MNKLIAASITTVVASLFAVSAFAADAPAKTSAPAATTTDAAAPVAKTKHKGKHHKKAAAKAAETK